MVETTHFGFEDVPLSEKQARVDDVFHKVASRYDLMNDLNQAFLGGNTVFAFFDGVAPHTGAVGASFGASPDDPTWLVKLGGEAARPQPPLQPQRIDELTWLGMDAATVERLLGLDLGAVTVIVDGVGG